MKATKWVNRFIVVATMAVMLFGSNVQVSQASGLNDLENGVRSIENTVNSGSRMLDTLEKVVKPLGLTLRRTKVGEHEIGEIVQQETQQTVAPTIDGFIWYTDNGQEYTGGITNGNVAKVHEVVNQHMSDNGVVFFSENDSAGFLQGYGLQELTAEDIPQWIMDAVVQKGWSQVWAYRVTGSRNATISVNSTNTQTLTQLPQLEEVGMDTMDVQYGQVLCINEKGAEMVDLSTSELLKKFAKKQMPNGISAFVAPRSYVQDAYLLWQTAGQEMVQAAHNNKAGHLYNMSQLGNLSVLTKQQVVVAEQAFGTGASNLACFKINRQTLEVSALEKFDFWMGIGNKVTEFTGKVIQIGRGNWKEAVGIYDNDYSYNW